MSVTDAPGVSRRGLGQGGDRAAGSGSPAAELAPTKSGLRMRPLRPIRVIAGLLLVVSAAVAALALYTRLGDRSEVLAVTRTVLAGEQIGPDDLRVVSIASDDALVTVPVSQRGEIVGQYARVRLASGALLVPDAVQPRPLVDPEMVLMAVEVPAGQIPVGLREQSEIALIVMPASSGAGRDVEVVTVLARVVAVPANLVQLIGGDGQGRQLVSLSVEVPPDQVAVVGLADSVSVGVLDPSADFTASAAGDGTANDDDPSDDGDEDGGEEEAGQ